MQERVKDKEEREWEGKEVMDRKNRGKTWERWEKGMKEGK